MTLRFEEALDTDNPPPLAAFGVRAGPAAGTLTTVAVTVLTMTERTVVLELAEAVPPSHAVRVSYTDPTAGDDGAALQNTVGADAESWRDEPVSNTGPPAATAPTARRPGGGGAPAEESSVPEPVGYLENPGANSFQSGIGVISGWVCEAEEVEIEIETESGAIMRLGAAYGTERLDTAGGCGDTDNGFGLLFNWNLLGDGEHEVVAFVDGIELARATVTVTTLGHEFLRDVTGTCEAEDFPTLGETVTLVWQQTSQNFVLAGGPVPDGENRARTGGVGYLENPGPHAFQSGVGVISGWVCEADEVLIELDGQAQPAGYGTERLDTQEVCGDTDNGFGLLFNWNLLGDGEHVVVARVDGEELGRATVRVTTLGAEFLRGAEGECVVEDFPTMGEMVTLEWQQNQSEFCHCGRGVREPTIWSCDDKRPALLSAFLGRASLHQGQMLTRQYDVAVLVNDFEQVNQHAVGGPPGIIAFVFDREADVDRVANKNRADKTDAVVAIGKRDRIDLRGRHPGTNTENQRAVGNALAKLIRLGPLGVHMVRKEVPGLSGMGDNIALGNRPTQGLARRASLVLFEIGCFDHGVSCFSPASARPTSSPIKSAKKRQCKGCPPTGRLRPARPSAPDANPGLHDIIKRYRDVKVKAPPAHGTTTARFPTNAFLVDGSVFSPVLARDRRL